MAEFFTNATDISLSTTGAWTDIDLSAYLPSDATGAIIRVVKTSGTNYSFGLRKNGSTDDNYGDLYVANQCTMYIGVDGSQICEGKIENVDLEFYLIGYFTTDATFFDNAYDKSPTTSGAWVDVDCSAELPSNAKFAIFDLIDTNAADEFAMRNNGSTDDRMQGSGLQHTGVIIGVDGGQICEVQCEAYTRFSLYLVGYITEGAAKTNGVDVSLSTTGAYTDIDLTSDSPPANVTGVIIEVTSEFLRMFNIRKNGSTDDFYNDNIGFSSHAIGIDGDDILEGKIEATLLDFYVIGYLVSAAAVAGRITKLAGEHRGFVGSGGGMVG